MKHFKQKSITGLLFPCFLVLLLTVFVQKVEAAPPANDDFANSITLNTTLPVSKLGNNIEATSEVDEPEGVGSGTPNSVWYTWVASEEGDITFDMCDATFDSTVTVYTGSSLTGLTPIDNDNDGCALSVYGATRMTFSAISSTTYHFQIRGYENNTQSDFTVQLSSVISPPAYINSINIPFTYKNTGTPRGMVMLPTGNIWYVDSQNTRLVQYNPTTNAIARTIGRLGTTEGTFDSGIWGIARDNTGNLYVLSYNCILYKLDPNGGFLAKYSLATCNQAWGITFDSFSGSLLVTSTLNTGSISKYNLSGEFISSIGEGGSGAGKLDSPRAIATDSSGHIYVTSEQNDNAMEIFAADGSFIREIKTWEDLGGGTTSAPNIQGVVILSDGSILIAAQDGEHVIEKFNSSGAHIATFRGGDRRFGSPQFIARDGSDNFYVSEWSTNAINKYDSSGTFLSSFSNNQHTAGVLYNPTDVAYNPADNHLYVIDRGASDVPRIQEFTNSGVFVGTAISTDAGIQTTRAGLAVLAFGPDGKLYTGGWDRIQVFSKSGSTWSFDYDFQSSDKGEDPDSGFGRVAFDSSGNLYAPEWFQSRVAKFNLVQQEDLSYKYEYVGAFLDSIALGGSPTSISIDSNNNIFVIVGDYAGTVKEYDSLGAFVKNIGSQGFDNKLIQYAIPVSVNVDKTNDYIYISDVGNNSFGSKIMVYNDSGTIGTLLNNYGTSGGGQMGFFNPIGTTINPSTLTLTIADQGNGRVQSVISGLRSQILNLIPSANVIVRIHEGGESTAMDAYVGESLSNLVWDPATEGINAVPARLMFGPYVVADFIVDLTEYRDWTNVNVQTLPWDSKSLVVNLNQTDAPGISQYHSLYLSKYTNQTSVNVCPDAVTLSEVAEDCSGEYTLNEGDSGLTAVTIDDKNYWKIDNLTGTGAFSTLFETGFTLSDIMTRQQISTTSNHEISFGTTYDFNHIGDTITIGFSSDWDIAGDLTVDNLSLYDWTGSGNLPLSDTASDNTWTVSFTTNPSKIVFTAPQNADVSSKVILAGNIIKIFINNEVLTNPSVAGSYMITMLLLTDSENTLETGYVNVPIVDSDTVNITGYVTAFMSFDIDTTTPESGGTYYPHCNSDSCLPYEGATNPASNYTVDLGELKSTDVNKSNSTAVMHSDGISGIINSIYFDLSTNAQGGAVVTVTSATNNGLEGPSDSNILPVGTDGDGIAENSGRYGFSVPTSVATMVDGIGIETNTSCDVADIYCGPLTTPKQVFNTTDSPIDTARVRMDIAAAASYTNVPGLYEDTLTFVATATF